MKIQFFFDAGHTFTASGVQDYHLTVDGSTFVYAGEKLVHDVENSFLCKVPMDDLLYAVITPQEVDIDLVGTLIVHGKATKFDIGVQAAQAAKMLDVAHEDALSEDRRRTRSAKESAKYRARKKARHISTHGNF